MTQSYAKFTHPISRAEIPVPPFSNLWAHKNGVSFLIVDRNDNPTLLINRRGIISKPPSHVAAKFRNTFRPVDRSKLKKV